MKPNRLRLSLPVLIITLALLPALSAVAQEGEQASEGKNWGNYNVRQSVEIGWRGADFSGNQAVYDTFVNLRQGARLFNQSLEMRSLNHSGVLFDDLSLTSFGYGGDPNNFSSLRISKNKWYDFNGSFRRDRNLWNYDLLANPLNPPTSTPFVPIIYSPHLMRFSRRMTDLNLVLLPQSQVRFRLGFTRNVNDGPSLTTFHEGTEPLLFQQWKTTLDSYQAGVDFKVLPRTNFSFDEFLNYYKGDTSQVDQNLTYRLPNGALVDLGVPFDTKARIPCAVPVTDFTTTPPTANPRCNGYLFYQRGAPLRTSYPTEQFGFQSNYFKKVDLAGRFTYSSSDSKDPNLQEFFRGLVTRTQQAQFSDTGPASAKRVSVSSDAAATWYATPKFRVIDEFRFIHFRIPGQFAELSTSLFGTSLVLAPIVFSPASCPPPFTASTCPPHNSSSPADVATRVSSRFLGQDIKLNSVQFEYDFTRRIGGRLGYRYRHRTVLHRDQVLANELFYPGTAPGIAPVNAARGDCASGPFNPDGTCTAIAFDSGEDITTINEHSLLLGVWFRPTDSLRLSYDQELMSADKAFTRISPRQLQHYKLRANYKPVHWAALGGTFNIYEARNNVAQIDHLEHSRNYGFNASLAPQESWGLDFGYNYSGIFSQTDICFIFGFGPPPPGFGPCPVLGSPVPLQALSFYNNKLHYGFADVMLKPVKRVTLRMGYGIDSVTGNTLILNPNSPTGPLNFNYHRPYGSVDVGLSKGITWRAGWGFYDYNEKDSSIDPTGPRSFRGNLVNLSVVYSF